MKTRGIVSFNKHGSNRFHVSPVQRTPQYAHRGPKPSVGIATANSVYPAPGACTTSTGPEQRRRAEMEAAGREGTAGEIGTKVQCAIMKAPAGGQV